LFVSLFLRSLTSIYICVYISLLHRLWRF
jgi:hypothetical protein